MEPKGLSCAILADRHLRLAEGVRNLLETTFEVVYVVANPESLRAGAQHLAPALIVLDLSLASGDLLPLLHRIRTLSPGSRIIVLTVHDQATVARRVLAAGADSVVLKRCVGTDFMRAVDIVLRGEQFVSPAFEPSPA